MADIEIEYLYGDGTDFVQCRGHVDPQAFCEAAWEQERVKVDPANVRHEYCRWVPDNRYGPGARPGLVAYWQAKPGRGAFAVTTADVDRCVPEDARA